MIYSIFIENISIYDEGYDFAILNPSLTTELNTAGSLSFTMPSTHYYYNMPLSLTQTIEVYEENELIWFGRPIDVRSGFFGHKEIYCEGALAFFNDSIQRPKEYNAILISEFFKTIISNHNSQVPFNRRFTVGKITIPDTYIYRKLDYETTFDCLSSMCVGAEGGFIFLRRENGVNYIDWLKDLDTIGDQPIQFAVNLLDLTQSINWADLKTSIIPIGNTGGNTKLTIAQINHGLDYIDSEAVSTFGRITKVVEFDVSTREKLLEKGQQWLKDQQWDPLTIELTAAELHYINPEYDSFKVGQIVHCTSTPHLIDRNFPLTKMSLNLDTAAKKITIGSPQRLTLTEIYKNGATQTKYVDLNYD